MRELLRLMGVVSGTAALRERVKQEKGRREPRMDANKKKKEIYVDEQDGRINKKNRSGCPPPRA